MIEQALVVFRRNFRKILLAITIVLLVLSFLFFYLAMSVNQIQTTRFYGSVTGNIPASSFYEDWGFGYLHEVSAMNIVMQKDDSLTVELYPSDWSGFFINGTLYVILVTGQPGSPREVFLAYCNVTHNLGFFGMTYVNKGWLDRLPLFVYLASQYVQLQTLHVVATVQHHPDDWRMWPFFSIGVILSLTTMISIYETKKPNRHSPRN